MATRRPRFKPTAILSARRPVTVTCSANIKKEPAIESSVKDEIKEEANTENVTQPARRLIKPSVCLPVRKLPLIAVSNSPLRATDLSPAEDKNSKGAVALFKSPVMSPSMQVANQPKSVELSQSMISPAEQSVTSESELHAGQLSPAKQLRQRIRPTPWFGSRRNSSSQNGYLSESDDEPLKRPRHLSTSSNHSMHCGGSNVKVGFSINSGRMRTESACSNFSDIAVVKEARYTLI